MVVGREHLHCHSAFNELYVFKNHSKENMERGVFIGPVKSIDYHFPFVRMTEAPEAKLKAKPEFEIDDEIEISFNSSFDDSSGTVKGKFKHLDPSGSYWVVDKDGFMRCGDFARKVKPMVTGYINRRQYSATKEMWKVFDDAAEKIIAGDFNV